MASSCLSLSIEQSADSSTWSFGLNIDPDLNRNPETTMHLLHGARAFPDSKITIVSPHQIPAAAWSGISEVTADLAPWTAADPVLPTWQPHYKQPHSWGLAGWQQIWRTEVLSLTHTLIPQSGLWKSQMDSGRLRLINSNWMPILIASVGVIIASMNQMPVFGFLQHLNVSPSLVPSTWECTADLKDTLPHIP